MSTGVGREKAERERRLIAQNSLFDVGGDGSFVPPRGVPTDRVARVSREIAERRRYGEVSIGDVERAGSVLGSGDRSAFGLAARTAREDTPQQAQRHFEFASARQIAATHLTPESREAAVTIGAARPEIVQQAFARDYDAFGWGATHAGKAAYDPRLMDQHGGLEQFRQEFEGKQAGSRDRPPDDEGLPF